MIPGPWAGLVLALAIYRLCRFAGWDDFPPIAKLRARAVGAEVITRGSLNARMGVTNESVETEIRYRHPTFEALLHCAFCLGAWLSLAAYIAWRLEPRWTLTVAAPLALSGAVGLIARNLDP